MTRVVHVLREDHDVYIGLPFRRRGLTSAWGNPYHIGRDGTRGEVIEKYRAFVLDRPDLLARLPELRGKVLACWCRPPEGFNGRLLCHGQILAGLVDEIAPEAVR